MDSLQYPLDFKFKITSLSNDFVAKDFSGRTIFYIREKILAWRDQMKVYTDESKSHLLYEIRSNRLIDFQQTFTITTSQGQVLGKLRRKTIRSFWRATFKLMNSADEHDFSITEKSVFVRFWDGIFGEIPLLGMLSGYVFNPSYILSSTAGDPLFEIKKKPSFFGRKFSVHKLKNDFVEGEERLVLSLALMVLIERDRG